MIGKRDNDNPNKTNHRKTLKTKSRKTINRHSLTINLTDKLLQP